MNQGAINRVASRWLRAAVSSVDAKAVREALGVTGKTLREMLPGLGYSMKYKDEGVPKFNFGEAPPMLLVRWQVPDTGIFAGVFPSKDIPLQVYWDSNRKVYKATSFDEEVTFRNVASVVAFMANAAKVKSFIRKGLKTLDEGTAAYFTGKLTPDSVVSRVLDVKANFSPVDEWHFTYLDITLMLRTSKKVPNKLLEEWVRNHWSEVQKLAPSKTPPQAGPRYRDYDYDEDGYDDGYDQPEPGLGWLIPSRMSWSDIEGVNIRQMGDRRAVVSVHASIR